MNVKSLFILAFAIVVFHGCITEPTACFELNKEIFECGEAVLFSNCSTDADEFTWDFGDSILSTDKDPIHVYTDTGTYVVKLYAMSHNSNKSNYCTGYILVTAASDKFIGTYMADFQNASCLLKITGGINNNAAVLFLDDLLFCNAIVTGNEISIDYQNYWNDDYEYIRAGSGTLINNQGVITLSINFIVADSVNQEHVIALNASRLIN